MQSILQTIGENFKFDKVFQESLQSVPENVGLKTYAATRWAPIWFQ